MRAAQRAVAAIGAPYRYGAAGPRAFDSSGLIDWAFAGTLPLPHLAPAFAQLGERVGPDRLQRGDVLLFSDGEAGVYLGQSRFVVADPASGHVRVGRLGTARWKLTEAVRLR